MDDPRVLALQVAQQALTLAGPEPLWVPDGADAGVSVMKAIPAKRYTLGVAYPAMKADIGVAMDGHRDYASAEVVEKAAGGYLADHRQIGLLHFSEDSTAGSVVESYIWRAPDWAMKAADGSEQVVTAGDWLLGVVWTDAAMKAILAGDVDGYSFVGQAARGKPTVDALARLRN